MAMYGFGYDQVNNKYKVLITYDFITKLHTFGTKSWTTIQTFPPCEPPLHWWDRVGKFVSSGSGTLNWLVGERDRIISFDLEKETYGEVLLPLAHHVDRDLPNNIEVLNNCLCLCYLNDMHCVLWLMNMYGIQESWTKLILIPRCKIPGPIGVFLHIRPLCISENGLVLMEVDYDRLYLQLVTYNALNGKLDYPKIMRPGSWHYMHIYHESSVSPL
ncbi:F-box protein CPR1-like [Lotus japonicus]|uniref:F-box protein CPR1-like n=1 Tax=Lotus japonicus TaxID=34305 RepID=UPI002583252C|nr:F-box protein CPR1-like [Lotus japonicus]